VEKFRGDTTTVGLCPKVWAGQEIKRGRSSAKDGAPERLRCGIILETLQLMTAGLLEEFFGFILHR